MNKLIKVNINYEIELTKNYPSQQPKVFCITKVINYLNQFCEPSISDYRDLLEQVLRKKWNDKLNLISIVQRLPKFTAAFLKSMFEGNVHFIGKYYLAERYSLKRLLRLPGCKTTLFRYQKSAMVDEHRWLF